MKRPDTHAALERSASHRLSDSESDGIGNEDSHTVHQLRTFVSPSDDVPVPSSALEAALDPALDPAREQTTATPTRLFSPGHHSQDEKHLKNDAPFIFRAHLYKLNEKMMKAAVYPVLLMNLCVIVSVVLALVPGSLDHWNTVPAKGEGEPNGMLERLLCNSTKTVTLAELGNLTGLAKDVRNFNNATCIGNVNIGYVGSHLGRLVLHLFGAIFFFTVNSVVNQKADKRKNSWCAEKAAVVMKPCNGGETGDLSPAMVARLEAIEKRKNLKGREALAEEKNYDSTPRMRCAILARYLMVEHKNSNTAATNTAEMSTSVVSCFERQAQQASCFHLPVHNDAGQNEEVEPDDYTIMDVKAVVDEVDDYDTSDKFHPGVYAPDECGGCPRSPFFWMIVCINAFQIAWLVMLCSDRVRHHSDDAFQHFSAIAGKLNVVLTLFAATVGFPAAGAEFRLISRYFSRFLYAMGGFASDRLASEVSDDGSKESQAGDENEVKQFVRSASQLCWDGPDDIKRDYDLLRTLYKAASHEWRLLTALCFAFGVLSFAISCVMLIKDGLKVSWFFSLVGGILVFFSAASLQLYVNMPFDKLKEKLDLSWAENEKENVPFEAEEFHKVAESLEAQITDKPQEQVQDDDENSGTETTQADDDPQKRLREIEFELQSGPLPMRTYFFTYPVRFKLYGFVLTTKWFWGLVTSSSITTFTTMFLAVYAQAQQNRPH